MALGPVVAAALTTPAAKLWSLTIGGLEVSRQAGGAAGTSYGVEIETVVVTEAACDRISGLAFTLDDPAGVLTFDERAEVRLHDCVRDVPLFLGFLDQIGTVQDGLARRLKISAIGVEAVLDWMILPSALIGDLFTVLTLTQAVQSLVAQTTGGFPLRAFSDPSGGASSTQATPIANVSGAIPFPDGTNPADCSGMTLRQAIAYAVQLYGGPQGKPGCTVDFYGGLRLFAQTAIGTPPAVVWINSAPDAQSIGISPIGPYYGGKTDMGATYSEIVHRVLIRGGNAAGSGLVTDGAATIGPTPIFSDSTIKTAAARDALGRTIILGRGANLYGSTTIESIIVKDAGEHRAYGAITISDPELGFTGATFATLPILSIRKSFASSGMETWEVEFGSQVGAGSHLLRRLTASQVL